MGDRPPDPPDPNPANPTQRTFLSSTAAGEFFNNLQVVLDRQHAQTLASQEALVDRMTESFTGVLERILGALQGPAPQSPASNPASQAPSIQRRSPPPPPINFNERPSEEHPVDVYRSAYRDPPPVRDPRPPREPPFPAPPVREQTAFTFATAETAGSAYGGRISGIKVPEFNGDDGENVVAWLQQLKRYFRLKNTADARKVDLASFALLL